MKKYWEKIHAQVNKPKNGKMNFLKIFDTKRIKKKKNKHKLKSLNGIINDLLHQDYKLVMFMDLSNQMIASKKSTNYDILSTLKSAVSIG